MTEPKELSFTADGVYPGFRVTLNSGKDINPLPFEEQDKNSLQWHNWNAGFSRLEIPGLTYRDCQLSVNYFIYANRENREDPQLSRGYAVVSHWDLSPDARERYQLGDNASQVTVYFPIYDGIGYWIGKRRREDGFDPYSPEITSNIARVSAEGSVGQPERLKPQPGEVIYQCVWMPGKLFAAEGSMLSSISTSVFLELGFTPVEIKKRSHTGDKELPFKLFGRVLEHGENGNSLLPFNSKLAEDLHDAWKYVNMQDSMIDNPPDANSY